MKQKNFHKKLISYEIRNIIGNPFVTFFGGVFPIIMLFIITRAISADTPSNMMTHVNTGIFISMSLIIPMAVVLLGYAATYSQELEKDIPLRIGLFGYKQKSLTIAKAVAQLLAMSVMLGIYMLVGIIGIPLSTPTLFAVVCWIACLYLLGIVFFLLAHGVASLIKKFGPTYALMMVFYFLSMILCGMMGIQTDNLPAVLQSIAWLLPMSHIANDFVILWEGGSYQFAPLAQSFLFLAAVSGIILFFALRKNKRVIK